MLGIAERLCTDKGLDWAFCNIVMPQHTMAGAFEATNFKITVRLEQCLRS